MSTNMNATSSHKPECFFYLCHVSSSTPDTILVSSYPHPNPAFQDCSRTLHNQGVCFCPDSWSSMSSITYVFNSKLHVHSSRKTWQPTTNFYTCACVTLSNALVDSLCIRNGVPNVSNLCARSRSTSRSQLLPLHLLKSGSFWPNKRSPVRTPGLTFFTQGKAEICECL